MGTPRVALVVILLAACGDDSATARVDASDNDGNGSDGNGSDGGNNIVCDYTETTDGANGTLGTAEDSMLSVGTTGFTICGKINPGHFDAGLEVVDGDFYKFTATAGSNVIVRVVGTGLTTPQQVLLQVNRQGTFSFFGFGTVVGDHAAAVASFPANASNYTIAVGAVNPTDLSAAIDYAIIVTVDTPSTRCAAKTGTADHPEGTDGGANDVVSYDSTRNPESKLTTATTDAPEASGITVAPAASYLVTGNLPAATATDDYQDRDTFAFTTGATTNEMSVRLNWPSTTSDLDFRVYPETTGDPLSIVGGLKASGSQDEFQTFAVKPNTTYWLWVAASDGAATTAYSATLCGDTFAP